MLLQNESVHTNSSDATLVAGLLRREPTAWRELQRRYGAILRHVIYKVVVRSKHAVHEDVEEILGHVMLSLFENGMKRLRAFDATRGTPFSSWLTRIAKNRAIDHVRWLTNRGRLAQTLRYEPLRANSTPTPYETLRDKEDLRALNRATRSCTDNERAFLRLYYEEAKDPREVAKRLGISVSTVYSKRHKIQERLRAETLGSPCGSLDIVGTQP